MIHRDLKPANIKVRTDGTAKLLDFGLAKALDLKLDPHPSEVSAARDTATVSGVILGTPAYMSPEQTRGEELAPCSDIFSLGSVLYEVVTGVPAFRGSSFPDTLRQVTMFQPPPPSSLRSELPVEWDVILQGALEKERDRRYQSAADLARDLEAVWTRMEQPGSWTEEREPDPVFGRDVELEQLDALLSSAVDGSTDGQSSASVNSRVTEPAKKSRWPQPGARDALQTSSRIGQFPQIERKDQGERRSMPEFAFNTNLTLMILDYLRGDGESQTGPDSTVLGCETGIEYVR